MMTLVLVDGETIGITAASLNLWTGAGPQGAIPEWPNTLTSIHVDRIALLLECSEVEMTR